MSPATRRRMARCGPRRAAGGQRHAAGKGLGAHSLRPPPQVKIQAGSDVRLRIVGTRVDAANIVSSRWHAGAGTCTCLLVQGGAAGCRTPQLAKHISDACATLAIALRYSLLWARSKKTTLASLRADNSSSEQRSTDRGRTSVRARRLLHPPAVGPRACLCVP